MPYCFPSYAPGSARPLSQVLPPSSPTLSLRSSRPPLWANWATWVLPVSMTSGASLLASAAVTFSPMPSHSWICTLALMFGWAASKPFTNSFWNCAETLSRMSQTSIVVVPPAESPDDPESPLQALTPEAITSADTPASMRSFTVHPWKESAGKTDQLSNWTGDLSLVDEGG